ncbi:hypothetical protein [Phaffia rhodozyma]|uniref:Transmembrane protein n=1 Tax=Phaffia rhodozyma TaxID=264483 RepID=A0A0F7SLN5_PHARH|nr:hypothetical protein [Phaffia rhodozyma]
MDVRSRLNAKQQAYLDLAESHYSKDLEPSDREALKKAAGKVRNHVFVGGLVGSAVGLALAWRGRVGIHRALVTLRQAPKPVEIIMESGEHVQVSKEVYKRQFSEPGPLTTFLSTFIVSTFGLLVGTNVALLTGTSSAKKVVIQEANVERVKAAYRGFQIDILKKELEDLESGKPQQKFGWGGAFEL